MQKIAPLPFNQKLISIVSHVLFIFAKYYREMNTGEVHQNLQNLCNLGIVKKENVDIRILLALTQISEAEAREHLRKLEKHNYVSVSGDSIQITDLGSNLLCTELLFNKQ